jgi:DNA-binding PucR family transcriptional regulator
VARGARDLSIHQNTLRHRLARFEQLARVDLSGLEATFEVWWALQYWTLYRTRITEPRTGPAKGAIVVE